MKPCVECHELNLKQLITLSRMTDWTRKVSLFMDQVRLVRSSRRRWAPVQQSRHLSVWNVTAIIPHADDA
jgi:hypothetical protein